MVEVYDETHSSFEAIQPTVVEGTGEICVDITGILADSLNATYTVTFNGGSIRINALQFAKATGGNTDFGRSMYNYYTAADAYFN